jgi:osmoprotectant transport system substrate-binding protein
MSCGARHPRSVPTYLVAGSLVLSLVSACVADHPQPGDTTLRDRSVTVGSFDFPESVLLAELYAQSLEAHGIQVRRRLAIGPRELVMPSLERGLVEVVPEYSGSLLAFLGGSVPDDRAEMFVRLRPLVVASNLRLLRPARAQNQNGFVVSAFTARELGVETLSDLRSHAAALRFGGPAECPRRPLCLRGLEATYGLRFAEFIPLDAGGPLTIEAIRNDLVDVALLFSSDGSLDAPDLVLLEDDRALQPPEHVVPIVHAALVDRFGAGLVRALDAVSGELTTGALRHMNAAVASGGAPADVARRWLTERGLAGTD